MKQKKNQAAAKGNRFLISVTVLGSAGPIRLVVSEDELIGAVIDTALKSYAISMISFYTAQLPGLKLCFHGRRSGHRACETSCCARSSGQMKFPRPGRPPELGIWKAWFTKSRSLKISSH